MKSYAKICLKNHSQDTMIKEKLCPYRSWNYSSTSNAETNDYRLITNGVIIHDSHRGAWWFASHDRQTFF